MNYEVRLWVFSGHGLILYFAIVSADREVYLEHPYSDSHIQIYVSRYCSTCHVVIALRGSLSERHANQLLDAL